MVNESFKYDVFISHSSQDKPAVRELAERLKRDGLRVWFDEWEIKPGSKVGLKIQKGLEQSRTLVLVMSANVLASEWVKLERNTALFCDPTNQQRRFIPLRLDDAEIKDTLKQFAYVDWRQGSAEQYARLLAVCHPPVVAAEPAIEQQSASRGLRSVSPKTASSRPSRLMPLGQRNSSCRTRLTVKIRKKLNELRGSFENTFALLAAAGRRVRIA